MEFVFMTSGSVTHYNKKIFIVWFDNAIFLLIKKHILNEDEVLQTRKKKHQLKIKRSIDIIDNQIMHSTIVCLFPNLLSSNKTISFGIKFTLYKH